MRSVPPLIVTPPVKVFAPLSASTPEPASVKPKLPPMAPGMLSVPPLLIVIVGLVVNVIAPADWPRAFVPW